jgi:hypothetical protein
MATQSSVIDRTGPPPLTFSVSDISDLPLVVLDDPEPDTPRGRQFQRLEQLGLYKSAQAVSACGRLGEKSTYECGELRSTTLRSHRRFCCCYCDSYVASKLFKEHRAYRERLHPRGALFLVTVKSADSTLSGDNIRNFEDRVVGSVRRKFESCEGWGFKSFTQYESDCLIAKAILYLPAGTFPTAASLSIPNATCTVSAGASVHAFDKMLAMILQPTVTVGFGILRANLMAAFQGGNHLRSVGLFYGLVSKNRRREPPTRNEGKLHLSGSPEQDVLGAGFVQPERPAFPYVPPCPRHGARCKRVAVARELMSDLKGVPRFEEFSSVDRFWIVMQQLLRQKRVF